MLDGKLRSGGGFVRMQSLENIDVVIKFSWAQFATIADAVEAGFRELDSHVANFPRRWILDGYLCVVVVRIQERWQLLDGWWSNRRRWDDRLELR